MPETERERLATLETQMKELVGNGQPGRIGRIEAKLDELGQQGRYIYIGIGILATLQFVAPMLLKRVGGG
jgi:hypothetical protein